MSFTMRMKNLVSLFAQGTDENQMAFFIEIAKRNVTVESLLGLMEREFGGVGYTFYSRSQLTLQGLLIILSPAFAINQGIHRASSLFTPKRPDSLQQILNEFNQGDISAQIDQNTLNTFKQRINATPTSFEDKRSALTALEEKVEEAKKTSVELLLLAMLFVKTRTKIFYGKTLSTSSLEQSQELVQWRQFSVESRSSQNPPSQDSYLFQQMYRQINNNLTAEKKVYFQSAVALYLNTEATESLVRRQKEFLISLNQQVQSDGWEGQKVTLKWFDSNKRPDGIQRLRVLLNQINQSNQEGSQPLAPTTIKQIFSQVNHLLDEKVNHRCFTRKASTAQFYSRIWQEAFQVSRLETQNDNPAATPISSMR